MKHPIHPMLVYFPIACWSIATCIDVISPFYNLQQFEISGVLILIGLLLAFPAMLSGLIEIIKIDNASAAIAIVNKHMLFVLATWMFYAISLYIRFDKMVISQPDWLAITTSVFGFISLSIAGWYGGNLVYNYNIGRDNKQ